MLASRARFARNGSDAGCPACRLALIVLVAACGGQRALAQTAAPGGHRTIQPAQVDHSPPRERRSDHTEYRSRTMSCIPDAKAVDWRRLG